MRIKITFVKTFKSPNTLPLHHQMMLSRNLSPYLESTSDSKILFNFSTIKGSSNVKDGNISFLTNRVSLVVSSNNDDYLKSFVKRIFAKNVVKIGKMLLIPKQQQEITMPEFKTEMKYVCLSPFVLINPEKEPERKETIIDPNTHEFSDLLFNTTMERMHDAGITEEELKNYETFEAIADFEYLKRIIDSNKRFARFYRNLAGETLVGYLLPFTLHAHPKVHEFIFNAGLGLYTSEGYGMIDVVPDNFQPTVKPIRSINESSDYSGPSADDFFS